MSPRADSVFILRRPFPAVDELRLCRLESSIVNLSLASNLYEFSFVASSPDVELVYYNFRVRGLGVSEIPRPKCLEILERLGPLVGVLVPSFVSICVSLSKS